MFENLKKKKECLIIYLFLSSYFITHFTLTLIHPNLFHPLNHLCIVSYITPKTFTCTTSNVLCNQRNHVRHAKSICSSLIAYKTVILDLGQFL